MPKGSKDQQAEAQGAARPGVRWNDDKMGTSYANACNVISSREEVAFFFGLNQGARNGDSQVTVELSDRVILTPHAAKRFQLMLNSVLQQHEARFGEIKMIDIVQQQETVEAS